MAFAAMYSNKLALAPMVRVGTLPMRLLSLRYGADLVYTEEYIDHKMLQCTRIENTLLNTVDFVLDNGTVVFRTCAEEKDKVIFQMGTSDPERAVKTAKLVAQDVAGIDVNMGCPKPYSVLGGMGAALLSTAETAREILSALVKEVDLPITCKMRLLPTKEESVAFAKMMESTGIAALGVHSRFIHERPRDPAHHDFVQAIVDAVKIPVIASGGALDYLSHEQLPDFKEATKASSLMLARAAQWNPSVFRAEGELPARDVMRDYLKVAIDVDNVWENTKYVLLGLLHDGRNADLAETLGQCKSYPAACEIFGIGEYWKQAEETRTKREQELAESRKRPLDSEETEQDGTTKRVRMTEKAGGIRFNRHEWPNDATPKAVLNQWVKEKKLTAPVFEIEENKDRNFRASVHVAGGDFESHTWERSKKFAEQAAAAVVLMALDIPYAKLDPITKQKVYYNVHLNGSADKEDKEAQQLTEATAS